MKTRTDGVGRRNGADAWFTGEGQVTLRPDRAALEIASRVYNGNAASFLVVGQPGERGRYQSVFPPDVTAVFDHGKRAVSAFPIATGTYYKVDYSAEGHFPLQKMCPFQPHIWLKITVRFCWRVVSR